MVGPDINLGIHHLPERLAELDKLLLTALPWQVSHMQYLRRRLRVPKLWLPSRRSHLTTRNNTTTTRDTTNKRQQTPAKYRRPARNTIERNPKPIKKKPPEMIKRRALFQSGNNRKRVIFRDRERTTAMTPELLQERRHCYANPSFVLFSLPPSLPLSLSLSLSLRTPLEFFTLLARWCTPPAAGG